MVRDSHDQNNERNTENNEQNNEVPWSLDQKEEEGYASLEERNYLQRFRSSTQKKKKKNSGGHVVVMVEVVGTPFPVFHASPHTLFTSPGVQWCLKSVPGCRSVPSRCPITR